MTVHKREYKDYNEYLNKQSAKLNYLLSKKNYWSQRVRPECFHKTRRKFIKRLKKISKYIKGNRVLCLGARTGAEVSAFRKLGF